MQVQTVRSMVSTSGLRRIGIDRDADRVDSQVPKDVERKVALEAWRQAGRRAAECDPGSAARTEAEAVLARRRAEYLDLTRR